MEGCSEWWLVGIQRYNHIEIGSWFLLIASSVLICISFLTYSSITIRRQLDAPPPPPPTSSPGCPPPAPNPYVQRILDIRETVTLNKRIPNVAKRLRKCMTRTGFCQWHCILGLLIGVFLGILFYQLPQTRAGIEKRENLFRVIVCHDRYYNCA